MTHMDFPEPEHVDALLGAAELPRLARVSYEPEAPELGDVVGATEDAMATLPLDPAGVNTVAIGIGSRGIHDIVPIAETAISWLDERGYEPIVIPAMGAHGGATGDGQRGVLNELGITDARLGCTIDARMDTSVVGQASIGGRQIDVHVATAAVEADVVIPINRVKPHTTFSGRLESGLCKMLVVGLGKQAGASTFHRYGTTHGFVAVLEAVVPVIRDAVGVPGGVAIVENAAERTADVVGIPGSRLLAEEPAILKQAREHLATLPIEALDLLIVDAIGKDISGTGLDTNVVGRQGNSDIAPTATAVERIYARSLSERTHGNGYGLGFVDIAHRDVLEDLDLPTTSANALTSGSPRRAALPMVLPTDRHAVTALIESLGAVPTDDLLLGWIRDTGSLGEFRLSPAALSNIDDSAVQIEEWESCHFRNGQLHTSPAAPP